MSDTPRFHAIPILRIFDLPKAMEFYVDFAGFSVDWTHQFDGEGPVYLQVSREGLILHLSEHHGDSSPATRVFVRSSKVRELHAEFAAKNYTHNRPGLEDRPWGLEVTIVDPFHNRLTFCQQDAAVSQ